MIGLSPSTYYHRAKRSRWEQEFEDAELRDAIEAIQVEHPSSGYRTVQVYLRRQGRWIGERRIPRVMKQYCLQAEVKRAFIRTTDSRHGHRVYPNLPDGRVLTGINQAWGADFTYIRIVNGFVYVAVILDLFSRKVVGWAISNTSIRSLRCRRTPSDPNASAAARLRTTLRPWRAIPVARLHRGIERARL